MSKKKTSIPAAPAFQADPNVAWSQDRLKEQYGYLMNGLTQEGQSLSGGLGEATNISPEISRLSMQYAQSQLDPAFRQRRQQTINDLEASNQLTGSTTASALGNLDADYMASLTGMQAQYGIADVNRALNNRVQLYTQGLNVGQNVGTQGLSNQDQMNSFALANYENQVAAALANQGGGSPWGAIGGAVVGGIAGSVLPGVGTVIGAGLGSAIGNAAFGGGNSAGGGIGTAGAMLGGYMAGSKSSYAPTPYTYSSGSESVTNSLAGYQAPSSFGYNWRY